MEVTEETQGVTTEIADALSGDTPEGAIVEEAVVEESGGEAPNESGAANENPEVGTSEETPEASESPEFTYEAFDSADPDTVFKDSDGNQFKKVEGCDVPVPVIPQDDEMYQFLQAGGFDQNVINEEFWANKGELSEETLAALTEVYGAGPVNSYMANCKYAHLAYLNSAKEKSEAAARDAEAKQKAVADRDAKTYDLIATVFELPDGEGRSDASKDKTKEIIQFCNENWSEDRRREFARVLNTGSDYLLKTVMKSIKREMDFQSGEVHNLVDLSGTDTTATTPEAGSVGNFLTAEQAHDIMYGADRKKYWTDSTYAAQVDAARLRGIRLGK